MRFAVSYYGFTKNRSSSADGDPWLEEIFCKLSYYLIRLDVDYVACQFSGCRGNASKLYQFF